MTAAKTRAVRSAGFRGRAWAGIELGALLELLGGDPLGRLPALSAVEFIKAKEDKGSRVYRAEVDLGRGPEEVFIKTFSDAAIFAVMRERTQGTAKARAKPHHYPLKLFKLLYRPSLARRSFRAALACSAAGIAVADHLLYLSRRRGFFREEVLVTRGVNPRSANNAKNYFLLNFRVPNDAALRRRKRELLVELGGLLRRVAASGLTFPDFKLHNLVLEEGERPRFLAIDLCEVKRWRCPEGLLLRRFEPSVPKPPVVTGLDRMRLLRAYLAAGSDRRSRAELCRVIRRKPGADREPPAA
jgi:hypothetical protein